MGFPKFGQARGKKKGKGIWRAATHHRSLRSPSAGTYFVVEVVRVFP